MSRCCQSGVRWPGRRRGISSARAAFSRKRAPYSADCASSPRTRSSISAGSSSKSSSGGAVSGVGEVQRDAVVRPQRLHVEVERLAQTRAQRHRPGRVHAAPERREDADAPVADLVAKALDDECPVGGDDAGCRLLLAEEGHEVARRERLEPVFALHTPDRRRIGESRQLAGSAADLLAELGGAADSLPFPERRNSGHAGSRRNENAVARDLVDAPGRRAEDEGLAFPSLVDHLLVELPHPAAAVREEHAEESAVGNRPRVRDGEPAGARAPSHRSRDPVPHDARPQLGELVGRIAAREHVEHVLELRRGRAPRTVRAPGERWRSSTVTSSSAQIATICCARTSSGFRGCRVSSISPARMARATTADARRSALNLGKMRPFETERRSCPARPTRCRPRAADFGLSTWITRSTAPMSMPSSSEDVATRHGIRPALSSSSTTTRCSRASEPWCARASSSSASSLMRSARRSASRRLLTKTIVERCARTSSRIAG